MAKSNDLNLSQQNPSPTSWVLSEHRIMTISLSDIGGSALTDVNLKVPKYKESNEIPITYVPARNTIFLSFRACLG